MLMILSPSKDMQNLSAQHLKGLDYSKPKYLDFAEILIKELQDYSPVQLAKLMLVNPKLAETNFLRIQNWIREHTPTNAIPAIFAYSGEAYRGLLAHTLNKEQLTVANASLRIISGLYGILRPLDLVKPYRLEMGIKHRFSDKKNLYEFWKEKLTFSVETALNQSPGEKILINLASQEYSSVIDLGKIGTPVISPEFMDEHNGKLKMVTVYTKRARGMMARFIIENQIEQAEDIKAFDLGGYRFDNGLSNAGRVVFTR
jgi:uncharacterized protein